MTLHKKLTIGVLIYSVFQFNLFADDVVDQSGNGGINWTKGIVYAQGYGVAPEGTAVRKQRLLARRAAQVDAYRNLAEMVSGVRVNSETVVKDMETASDIVRTKISAVIKGAVMTMDHYQNELAHVTMEIKIDGDLFNTIKKPVEQKTSYLPQLIIDKFDDAKPALSATLLSLLTPISVFNVAHASESTENRLIYNTSELEFAKKLRNRLNDVGQKQLLIELDAEIEQLESQFGFTGLLVDASTIANFELATIPRIRNQKGEVIYPKDELLEGDSLTRRPVSYDFDVDDAIRNERVAINPLIIKAQSVYKSRHSDLVISDADASAILVNSALNNVMNQAGVMIVVGG